MARFTRGQGPVQEGRCRRAQQTRKLVAILWDIFFGGRKWALCLERVVLPVIGAKASGAGQIKLCKPRNQPLGGLFHRNCGGVPAHVGAHPAGMIDANGNTLGRQINRQVAPKI